MRGIAASRLRSGYTRYKSMYVGGHKFVDGDCMLVTFKSQLLRGQMMVRYRWYAEVEVESTNFVEHVAFVDNYHINKDSNHLNGCPEFVYQDTAWLLLDLIQRIEIVHLIPSELARHPLVMYKNNYILNKLVFDTAPTDPATILATPETPSAIASDNS